MFINSAVQTSSPHIPDFACNRILPLFGLYATGEKEKSGSAGCYPSRAAMFYSKHEVML
jgi:hypothetical protein